MKGLLTVCLLLYSLAIQSAPRVYMTSLDWPPYSGESLIDNGLSVAVAREAFAAMGYELIVEFKPWVRTITLAAKKDQYIGYFPEYYFDSSEFVFSDPIGSGPLGIMENVKRPVAWSDLQDLKNLRIGVVQGYVNTKDFDSMVEQGLLQVEASANDIHNIYKVAKGRLDTAVIDKNVLDYLISIDRQADVLSQSVRMNRRLLENKLLYLAFKNTPEGNNWRDIFNQGLMKIDIDAILQRYGQADVDKIDRSASEQKKPESN